MLTFLMTFFNTSAETVTMFGGPDCGQWLSRTDTRKAWVLGFMSGINSVVANKNLDPLDKINSANQIFVWMDNYCRNNPLKTASDGGQILYKELLGN